MLAEPLTIVLESGGLDALNNGMKALHKLMRGASLPFDEFERLEHGSHGAPVLLEPWCIQRSYDTGVQFIVFGMQVAAGGFDFAMARQGLDHHQVACGLCQMAKA